MIRGPLLQMYTQRLIGRLVSPLWMPLLVAVMRFGFGWRIAGANEARRMYRRVLAESDAPLLVCGNHLTMVDSALIAWALGSPWWYVTHYDALPWNIPERDNFARTWWLRVLVYLMKCIPIHRGGERGEVAGVLASIRELMSAGEVALVFPEGGRSRAGHVDPHASTYGVGRIVKALPGCRVLCVYLRGEQQTSWSSFPARGDRFHVGLECFEPHTALGGVRGSVDISRQVLARLAHLESAHWQRVGTPPAGAGALGGAPRIVS